MYQFWDPVVRPVFDALRPSVIVEVGAAAGGHTRKMLPWAAENAAVVHVVDPMPHPKKFNQPQLEADFPASFVMHRMMSLDALAQFDDADAILLDGDHNWYTVYKELEAIDALREDWPVVFLHDVGWPYGRRDMYYAPETIPAAFRLPYRKAGLLRNTSALVDEGGKNAPAMNAEIEGGPRNGVVTGIEDFMAISKRDLIFLAVQGPAGLGILVERDMLRRLPAVAGVLREVHDIAFAVTLSPKFATRELAVG